MCNIDKFPTTIQMLNNELASYTWARKNWFQRVKESEKIHVVEEIHAFQYINVKYIVTPIYALARSPIEIRTLSQMQF